GEAKRDRREAGVPSCAEWPQCVRPVDYYLGAYRPARAPVEKKPPAKPTAVNGHDVSADGDELSKLRAVVEELREENAALESDLGEAGDVICGAVRSLLLGKNQEAYDTLVQALSFLGFLSEQDRERLEHLKLSHKAARQEAITIVSESRQD